MKTTTDSDGNLVLTFKPGECSDLYVIGDTGSDVVHVHKPRQVTVPTFDIVSSPTFPLDVHPDHVARAITLAEDSISEAEQNYRAVLQAHAGGRYRVQTIRKVPMRLDWADMQHVKVWTNVGFFLMLGASYDSVHMT